MYHSGLPAGGTCPIPEKYRRYFEWYGALNHSLRSGLGHSKPSGCAPNPGSEMISGSGYMARPYRIFCSGSWRGKHSGFAGIFAEVVEWHTRRSQKPVTSRLCGFDSHLRHHSASPFNGQNSGMASQELRQVESRMSLRSPTIAYVLKGEGGQ